MQNSYKLILITNRGDTPLSEYLSFIKICAESGVTSVQLREKNATLESLLEFGYCLKEILEPLKVPLIINDHINLAPQLQADGVHLGQTDGDPRQARAILGKDKIIGWTIETEEQLEQANQLPLTYSAVGAIFPSRTKHDIKVWGLSELSKLAKKSKHPLNAIGGITTQNVRHVMETGVAGISVIGTLHEAKDPAEVARTLRHMIDHYV